MYNLTVLPNISIKKKTQVMKRDFSLILLFPFFDHSHIISTVIYAPVFYHGFQGLYWNIFLIYITWVLSCLIFSQSKPFFLKNDTLPSWN